MANADGQYEELLALRYERLVPHLLAAVEALTQRIEELESKNMDFKKQVGNTMHFIPTWG